MDPIFFSANSEDIVPSFTEGAEQRECSSEGLSGEPEGLQVPVHVCVQGAVDPETKHITDISEPQTLMGLSACEFCSEKRGFKFYT